MLKKENKQINCHPEFSSGSNQNGFRNKFGMTGESGRSMVEMLGVLAVIGVLSVGGIAGYTSAMNKHRANELLHQVSMRATSCVAQLASGNTSLSVADFGDYDGYTFTPSYDSANKTYSIQIGGKTISKVVCNNMKNALPQNVQMTPTSCDDTNNNVKLTYQDDVSGIGGNTPTVPTSESCAAEDKKWCSGNNKCVTKGTSCCADVTLNTCLTGCDSSNGTLTYAREGTKCDLHGTKDGVCLSGVCSEIPATCDSEHLVGCTNNGDCRNAGGVMCDQTGEGDICMPLIECTKWWCEDQGMEVSQYSINAAKDNPNSFGEYCCRDGYEDGKQISGFIDEYNDMGPVCGCPSGSERIYSADACCNTTDIGFGGEPGDTSIDNWMPQNCGCPSDAPILAYSGSSSYYCCSTNGQGYDGDSSYVADLDSCLCPSPGEWKTNSNGVSACCYDGYAYDSNYGTFDSYNDICF